MSKASTAAAKKQAKTPKPKQQTPADTTNQDAAQEGIPGLNLGEELANKYIPAAQQVNAGRSEETTNFLNREKSIADQGLSSPEYQAEREQQLRGQQSALNTTMSNLAKAQARGHVYGAAASAQQANALNANNEAQINNEQQLMLKSEDLKRQGLQAYGGALNTAQQGEYDRSKFNIGEQDANTAARLGTIVNTSGLVSANQTNQLQSALGADAVQAAGGKLTNYNAAVNAAKRQLQRGRT